MKKSETEGRVLEKKAYCTYCSKEKRQDPVLLQAIKRYDSKRVRSVHQRARREGVEFLILSGEYGLLRVTDEIPNYDHLLKREEVGALVDRVVVQIKALRIGELVYFSKPWEGDPAIRPYLDTIAAACSRLKVPFTVEPISP